MSPSTRHVKKHAKARQRRRLTAQKRIARERRQGHCQLNAKRLLLDSRVVDVPMAYNPTCVIFSSLKPLFFNNLKNESCFSDHVGA
jgi:hypothetical protein